MRLTRQPRRTAKRHKLGIKRPRLQDWRCRRHGHKPNTAISVSTSSLAYWPICDRCGYGVETQDFVSARERSKGL